MGIIQLDYDPEAKQNAASGSFGVVPEGQYVLRLQSFEHQAPAGQDKAPQLVCKCVIAESFNQQNLNKVITRRFFLSPKAIPYRFEPFLKAAGIPYQDNGRGIAFDPAALMGATTRVTCRHKDGTDRKFEEWENDEPVGAAADRGVSFYQPPQFASVPQQAVPQQVASQQMAPQWGPPQQPPAQPQWGPPQGAPPQQGFGPPPQQPPGFQPQAAPQQNWAPPANGGNAPPWQAR